MDEPLSPAHHLGALTGGLARALDELIFRTHNRHATPGETWRDCRANSRSCTAAAELIAEIEQLAGTRVDADDFTDQVAFYVEAIALRERAP